MIEHEQDGTHAVELITSRTEDTNPDPDADFLLTYDTSAAALKKVKPSNLSGGISGWTSNILPSVSSVTNNGNRSYDVTFGSTVASYLTPGMRVRTSRTVAAPTQCADLEASSSQYFNDTSVSGMTFTDDFVVSAWVKLESYPGSSMTICGRFNGTSGWLFRVNSSGQAVCIGFNAGASNYSQVNSYQSLPLNKWVHVTAQLDMSTFTATSTTSYIMFDGVDVPATVARGGTNPTALVQAGDLTVGAYATGTEPFDGKIAQVAIYSAKVTQANVRATISQGLSGSETSLVSAYSFNNSINDLNANANNLTAQGSAAATNADSPFSVDANGTPGGTYDFGIVTKVATTTATVQVPEGCTIPTSGGVSAVDLSNVKVPYGFPADKGRWRVLVFWLAQISSSGTSTSTTYNPGGINLNVPVGNWDLGFMWQMQVSPSAAFINAYTALSTSSSAGTNFELSVRTTVQQTATSNAYLAQNAASTSISNTTATPYYALVRSEAAFTSFALRGDTTTAFGEGGKIYAYPADL